MYTASNLCFWTNELSFCFNLMIQYNNKAFTNDLELLFSLAYVHTVDVVWCL